jgi:hypothetical protein
MVSFSFKETEELIAEISVILLSFTLIVLVYLKPDAQYYEVFKDLLLILVGALVGLLGTKNLALPTAREKAALEEIKAPSISEDDKVA